MSCIFLIIIEPVDYISRVNGATEVRCEQKSCMPERSSKSVVVVVVYVEFCYMPPLVYYEYTVYRTNLFERFVACARGRNTG